MKDDPYGKARGKNTRPPSEGKALDAWVDAMWKTYRNTAPDQEGAEKNMMWVWESEATYQKAKGEWIPNDK